MRNPAQLHNLRILHLSDLHCGKETRSGAQWRFQRVLGEAWLANLREVSRDGKPDIVCFTGDLAQAGQAAEYEELSRFLDQTLSALDVGKERLFVVPGNHDIDRNVHPEAWQKLRAAPQAELGRFMAGGPTPFGWQTEWREQILARQQNFRNWQDRYWADCPRHITQNHAHLGYRVTLDGWALPIHLIGFDSAWLAGDEHDMGKLCLTDEQIGRHLAGLDGIKIAMLHHPPGELADGTASRGLVAEYGVHLVLHGHVHDPNHQRWQHPNHDRANLMQESVAGCLYEHDQYPNCMQVLDVALEGAAAGQVRQVWLRSWSKKGFWHNDDSHYRGSRDGRARLAGDTRAPAPDAPVHTHASAIAPVGAPALPSRKWVWHCTDESIAAGQVSLLAVAEIFAALGIYWWTAMHFKWPWMMFVGMVAAPMLLLRSKNSIKLGVELLRTYYHKKKYKASYIANLLVVICMLGMVAALSFPLVYGMLWHPQLLFWCAMVLGTGVSFVTHIGKRLITMSLIVGVGLGVINCLNGYTVKESFFGIIAIALALMLVGIGAAAYATFVGVVHMINGVVDGGTMLATVERRNTYTGIKKTLADSSILVTIIPFLAIGILLRGLQIRIYATLNFILPGLEQLPANWHEILLTIDFLQPPELIPQAGNVSDDLSVKSLWAMRHKHLGVKKIRLFFLLIAWYIPAIVYRWSLKATIWLWWPLALALTPPLYQQTPQASRRLVATIPTWHREIMALAAVIMVWLLSTSPLLASLLPLLPKEMLAIAHNLPAPPPPLGLRAILAYIGFGLSALLIFRSKNFKASHGKVMESPNEFNALNDADRAEFLAIAKSIDRIRLLLIAVIVLWGEAMALGLMHGHDARTVERFISAALLQYL
jgi:predicted MPP superfamily phosphohydrolase